MGNVIKKVVLYMATTVDGFIAGPNDEAEWVSENSWNSYIEFVKSCDVALVGKKTALLMPENEFLLDTKYFIATGSKTRINANFENISIQSAADLPDVDKIGIIGGGNFNGNMATLDLIDEIILDIEPLTLGNGIRLFGDHSPKLNLKLLSSKKFTNGTVQNHYKVV